ncbi:hypothetical protein E1B28_007764 [Marasmius oreades]|uniref:RanBD1 domain-containing protein n=1 Tax=Marasmius oreades TaxID=181124 RepID=A0A9P7S2J4_9AGAR|nr:uncharacterized protein E1B28_007764 [Marasmius oreades]KAG7094152.1 hypothetical protein E1B28_007764 [Marasmius oreades]
MSDSTRPRTPELGIRRTTPPPSPPSPEFNESDARLSRKREREVSLEPVGNPSSATGLEGTLGSEQKESWAPAKKNRIHLGSTAEEDDLDSRSRSHSPPLSTSPPYEMKIKVRQISQGVEDLSWKNLRQGQNEQVTESQETSMTTDPDVQTNQENKQESTSSDKVVSSLSAPPGNDPNASHRDSETDNGEKDKGLKRKFIERGTSAGPQEGDTRDSSAESTKRQRDDSENDDNPRETKRLTPPPETEKVSASSPTTTTAPKPGGFMAYASTSSPFAAVKGQNIFAASKSPSPKPPSTSASDSTSKPLSTLYKPPEESSTLTTPAKRSGFEAFASSTAPFTNVTRSKSPSIGLPSSSKFGRSKSPVGSSSAFSAYASGGMQGFALPPPQKRARAGSPGSYSLLERNSSAVVFALGGGDSNQDSQDSGAEDERTHRGLSSFGEKLRAGKDDDEGSGGEEDGSKVHLTEQEVTTGEEEEETIHQVRGKLFVLADGTWKERGTGLLKLNVRASDGGGARLVMRKEAVYTVMLNITLFHGMRCILAQDPRYLRFSAIENGATTHYNLRLANAKISKELLEEIHGNLPSV